MKNWRMAGAWFLIAASLALFAFGWNQRYESAATKRPVKIGIAIYRGDDPFILGISNAMELEVEKLEEQFNEKIQLKIVDAKNSQAVQNAQVDDFIRSGYQAIAVNIVDRTVAGGMIDKVKQAGIPIVFFNREPVQNDLEQWEKAFYVGNSAQESGKMEGQIVAAAFHQEPDRFDKNGDGKLQYVMLEGEEVHQDSLIRSETSVQEIAASGIEMEKLARAVGNWMRASAYEITNKWIGEFADEIELIISNNDEMALGALQAYQTLGKEFPPIVGIDGTKEAIQAVDEGKLLGTVTNDSQAQAKAILTIAYAAGRKKALQELLPELEGQYAWIPHKIYTKPLKE